MDDALKAQLIDSVDDTYLCEVRNKYTGYLGINNRDLIDHLLDRYGKITPADIEACKFQMNEPIKSSQPIDLFFQRINDCVQYASDGQVAFTNGKILQTAYHAVSTSGHYTDACKDWPKRPLHDKIWALFKQFFADKYHDLKEQQRVNISGSNFHSDNAAVDIGKALNNLALAATADREIVVRLNNTNASLVETITSITEQLRLDQANNAALDNKFRQHKPLVPGASNPQKDSVFDWAAWEAILDPTGYCWSHGYRVQCGHSSVNFKGKLGGHRDDATRGNTMGVSAKGQDK